MISYERKCIFVHIPKTGGTSIENAIWGPDWSQRTEEQLWMGIIRPGYNKYQSGGLQHLLATQIRQEVGTETFDECYRFAFIRNPWDKVISQFYYAKTQPLLLRAMHLRSWSSFRKYVRTIASMHEIHVQSFEQWRFILDDDGTQLVDFIGRFENLTSDFGVVARQLGLEDESLPHDMKSGKRRKSVREHYDRKSIDLVGETYARDIQMFGYEYQG